MTKAVVWVALVGGLLGAGCARPRTEVMGVSYTSPLTAAVQRTTAPVAPPTAWTSRPTARPGAPAGTLGAAAQNPARCPQAGPTLNVRDFDAVGDGTADDTKAIQSAQDAVAAKGGGTVSFPAGTYRAYAIQHDSCVTFLGAPGATLVHPDGKSPSSVVEGRVWTTTGSIAKGSRTLLVDNAAHLRVGAVVAIQAAGGRAPLQQTTLSLPATPISTTLDVRDTTGLPRQWTAYVFVGDEIVSFTGISGNTLLNVNRGLFGSAAMLHGAGTPVAQALRAYAEVQSVSGRSATLNRALSVPVLRAGVDIGSVGMSIRSLTVNGNHRPEGSPTNPFAVNYTLGRWITVSGATLTNGDHGGLSFDLGTRDSVVEKSTFVDNGDTVHSLGAAAWLFRGATRNTFRNNTFRGEQTNAILIDDRSTFASEYDAPSTGNTITANNIEVPYLAHAGTNAGIAVESSSSNQIIGNEIHGAMYGVMVQKAWQGTAPGDSVRNIVRANTLVDNYIPIWVNGSRNEFSSNILVRPQTEIRNSGTSNTFAGNVVRSS